MPTLKDREGKNDKEKMKDILKTTLELLEQKVYNATRNEKKSSKAPVLVNHLRLGVVPVLQAPVSGLYLRLESLPITLTPTLVYPLWFYISYCCCYCDKTP